MQNKNEKILTAVMLAMPVYCAIVATIIMWA